MSPYGSPWIAKEKGFQKFLCKTPLRKFMEIQKSIYQGDKHG